MEWRELNSAPSGMGGVERRLPELRIRLKQPERSLPFHHARSSIPAPTSSSPGSKNHAAEVEEEAAAATHVLCGVGGSGFTQSQGAMARLGQGGPGRR
ncbi:hypothetical protein AMELA_G00093300 [Ameiurus melas]|uniref:Uncharacterized protein n=1 Tax=Ameiurus melas TaxID=219545 RepID=A0A7J6AX76_AMEME|nr:hypothetical protein AMELA_G00093300 [Ameiurus melas]